MRTAIAVVLFCSLLTGCSFAAEAPGESSLGASAGTSLSPEQEAALSDGKVTFDEYDAAYRRYAACMKVAGFSVTFIGQIDGYLYDYRISDEAFKSQAQRECYNREFMQVDAAWQIANEGRSETSRLLTACLEKFDLPVPESVDSKVAELEKNNIDPATCAKR